MTPDQIRAAWSDQNINSNLSNQLPYVQIELLAEMTAQIAQLNMNIFGILDVLEQIRNRTL